MEFSKNHRVIFPPDEVVIYLISEQENLEAAACQIMPLDGENDNIPFDRFDDKCIETAKPIKIDADEYGINPMTSKGRDNTEHGIFIAKGEEKMPPDITWGLIGGRIYSYAIYA